MRGDLGLKTPILEEYYHGLAISRCRRRPKKVDGPKSAEEIEEAIKVQSSGKSVLTAEDLAVQASLGNAAGPLSQAQVAEFMQNVAQYEILMQTPCG